MRIIRCLAILVALNAAPVMAAAPPYRVLAQDKGHVAIVDSTGKVAYHLDWDTREELYAKLPVIGPVVQFPRRKLG